MSKTEEVDIVTRLRQFDWELPRSTSKLRREAADEIERLRRPALSGREEGLEIIAEKTRPMHEFMNELRDKERARIRVQALEEAVRAVYAAQKRWPNSLSYELASGIAGMVRAPSSVPLVRGEGKKG